MFVPLIDYHGGGDAAAFEPMSAHLAAYEMALAQYLGAGVAACYRGHRLYDTPAVQAVVAKWVAVYKAHRGIITSDIVHIRRPNGNTLDAFMHVDPFAAPTGPRGFLMVFNPTLVVRSELLLVPLYYTGMTTVAAVSHEGGAPAAYTLARDYSVLLNVTMGPESATWYVITEGA